MMPWEKPPVQEPDYNEIPDFLKRELPKDENDKTEQHNFPWGAVPKMREQRTV